MTTFELGTQINIDLSVEGRQVGSLAVPISTPAQPFLQHQIPLLVLHRGEGPVVCLTSGRQAGDVSGAVVLQRLAREIDINQINGTLILCPWLTPLMANPARTAEQMTQIMQVFSSTVLAAADVIVELSSGSETTISAPHGSVWPGADMERNQLSEELMIAFGAPDSVRRFDTPHTQDLVLIAEQLESPFLQVTLGHYAETDKASQFIGISGCRNVLLHTGVLSDAHFEMQSTRMLEVAKPHCRVSSPIRGLIHWHADLGGAVHRGNPMAEILDTDRAFADPILINAPMNGVLLAKHGKAFITPDQCLALIGDEVPR